MNKAEMGQPPQLTFGDVRRRTGGEIAGVTVSVALEGLSAHREVYLYSSADLREFFSGLATDWRGWSGIRTYESIEGELLLEARHTGSHVELSFTLQDPSFHDEWCVRGKVTLDAGEELSRASEDIQALFTARQ
ncbi:hypothetical protein QE394_001011 [Arthrobacter sp. SORGH_AS 212]|uniref:DUF6228 family protein n=1 Tax=Pseudarthrobacter sp. SORGH_AS 212 TaxID=3041777 RepID=UPI00278B6268|nr:hypothetical protein [Arthrobacter sp. SORGH_AS_0212]